MVALEQAQEEQGAVLLLLLLVADLLPGLLWLALLHPAQEERQQQTEGTCTPKVSTGGLTHWFCLVYQAALL
jgi:hypothetical protein